MKIIITSGFFNPLHSGHISYLREAARLGDKLMVIVNNDKQVELKGSKPFMDLKERLLIVGSLKDVDYVWGSISEDISVCEDLRDLAKLYSSDNLIFAKGGDRVLDNIPEASVCKELGISMVFGVGCEKVQSSSKLLKNI